MTPIFESLTIVTTCTRYGKYLPQWSASIARQTMRPGAVVVFTHGMESDREAGRLALAAINQAGITVTHVHHPGTLDFGVARNHAVALAQTDWAMHLDADDSLLPHAIADFAALAPHADVISAGYVLSGTVFGTTSRRDRLYQNADGPAALHMTALCSGVSPFRKSLWAQSPYRTDMLGAWDTALWIGFAHLGARFRATTRAVFVYHQHADSIFNVRRRVLGWARVRTTAQLKALRRRYTGVAVIVPRDLAPHPDRDRVWSRVRAHYATHHPEWTIREGRCPTQTWVKGAALAHAISGSSEEILVLADADCLVDPGVLRATVERVKNGAPWAMPHRMVYRASAARTLYHCQEDAEIVPFISSDYRDLDRAPYEGAPGGGIVVIRRVCYDAIGGIPHAFRGWGSEDRALACLADTLLGPCDRGDADLLHLYHPPQAKESSTNLQLLRHLGYAAQKGKDALVAVAYAMPNPAKTLFTREPLPAVLRPRRHPINLQKIETRQAEIAAKRRRLP